MDLALSREDRDLQEAARRFARRAISPIADRMDREDYFPRDVFSELGDHGFLGLTVPEKFGGLGQSYIAQAVVLEEIARVSPALALSVGAHSNLFADNAARNGNDEQRSTFLPPVVAGTQIGALALTEPNAGSDAVSIRTRAERHGSHYLLNGTKQFITNGPVADVLLVYAKTAPEKGARGISAFLVRRDSAGFSVTRSLDKMGMRGSPTGELAFQDVEVPRDQLVGHENDGVRIMMSGLNVERAVLTAIPVGIMAECLDRSVAYAREREQFGQKIGRFQGISFKLADMETRTAAARELLYKACAMADQNHPEKGKYSSMAKVFCSDTAMAVTIDAVQVLGGYGYVKEYPVERMMRDAKITQIYEGTNEIQRVVIARTLR